MNDKILLISDIIEQKVRKEKELEYYQQQLDERQQKMWWLKKEIEEVELIISIIETEKADILKLKKPEE